MKAGIMVAACAGIPLTARFTDAQNVGDKASKTSSVDKGLAQTPADMLGYYNKSTFAPYVNTEFSVHLTSVKVRKIKLVEVRDYTNASGQGTKVETGEECFSLFFTAPSGRYFPQNTYEVEHPALGTFSLFIVPTGKRSVGDQYFEAAFNRCNQYSTQYLLPVPVAPSSGKVQKSPISVTTEKAPISVMTQESPTINTPTPPVKPRRKQID